MKQLFLVRHAKSDWPAGVGDFNRPLANRGVNDAHKMADFMKDRIWMPDQLVTSPANRALSTCKIFSEILVKPYSEDIRLYHAGIPQFQEVILDLDDAWDRVAIFSHNDGITHFADALSEVSVHHIPTCGVVGFTLDIDHWKDFLLFHNTFLFFYKPKEL